MDNFSFFWYLSLCVQDGEVGKKACAYLATPLEAEHVYAQLYRKHTAMPQALVKTDYIASQIGSNRLKKVPPQVSMCTVVVLGTRSVLNS